MDAITTPPITLLVAKLRTDYPDYHFSKAQEFRWSPQARTIFYDTEAGDSAALLHEVAHALLGHAGYQRDVELIAIERAAWDYAYEKLASSYGITITLDQIEDALDTYRDWLHARSTCPSCQATGLQIEARSYRCVACFTQWYVNDARICALRRWRDIPTTQQKERS